jgi:hypothetical protein
MGWFSARETVIALTPARFATSRILGNDVALVFLFHALVLALIPRQLPVDAHERVHCALAYPLTDSRNSYRGDGGLHGGPTISYTNSAEKAPKAEVLGLEVGHVNFQRNTMTFRPHAHRRLKTATSHRTIPLEPQLKEILRAHIREHTLEQLVAELRKIEPRILLQVERIPLKSRREVLVVPIVATGDGPYTHDGRAYIREGPTTVPMPREVYQRALLERMHPQRRWELQAAADFSVADLDAAEIVRSASSVSRDSGARTRASSSIIARRSETLLRFSREHSVSCVIIFRSRGALSLISSRESMTRSTRRPPFAKLSRTPLPSRLRSCRWFGEHRHLR